MPSDLLSQPRLTETRIQHYLSLAKDLCYYSDNKKARLGSVVVYKNKIISTGYNLENKTCPLQETYNRLRGYDVDVKYTKSSIHAEFSAMLKIKDIDIDFSKVHLFVYRIKRNNNSGYARPCAACMGFAKALGIKHIYYSTENNGGWCYERLW